MPLSDPTRRALASEASSLPHDRTGFVRLPNPRIGLAALALASSMRATAAPIACPAAIVETPAVTSVWPGWAAEVRAGRRVLASAAIYVSRGSERGVVAPDASHASGRDERSTWSLQPGEGDVYWVGCSYADTSATLFQRIPETARRCSAAYENGITGRRLQGRAVDCE
ncbi:MAG: STY0301 family protein [Betaproteobacteria bacterium]